MHQWAVDLVMNSYPDIGDHYAVVDSKTQKAINRAYLQNVVQNIIFLSRQGLPFRGNWILSEDGSGGCEKESNFYQLRSKNDPGMLHVKQTSTQTTIYKMN